MTAQPYANALSMLKNYSVSGNYTDKWKKYDSKNLMYDSRNLMQMMQPDNYACILEKR